MLSQTPLLGHACCRFCRTKPVAGKKFQAKPFRAEDFYGRKNFDRKIFGSSGFRAVHFPARELSTGVFFGFSTFELGKNPAKKFSAQKIGVSLSAATRIIIRSADVHLTPDFFHRREFPTAIPTFLKNAGPPAPAKIFRPQKNPEFIFSTGIFFRPGTFNPKKSGRPGFQRERSCGNVCGLWTVRIFERGKCTDALKKVPAQSHAISADRMHPIKIAPNVPAPPILTCGTSRSPM